MKKYHRKAEAVDDSPTICLLDRKNKTIYISGDINQEVATRFRKFINSFSPSSSPIIVELNSQGGEIEPGLMMVDTIRLSKTPVLVRATGYAMSIACVVLCSGHIREALPNTTIMAHQGVYGFNEKYHDIDNEVEEAKRVERLCLDLMDKFSKKSKGYWESRCGTKNLYLTPKMAISAGLIDRICK